MPRPRIELSDWADQIRTWQKEGVSYQNMRYMIEENTGVSISKATWTRRLNELGIQQRLSEADTVELRLRIAYLFSALRLTDAESVDILKYDGFKLNTRSLSRIRRDMGLLKSTHRTSFEQVEAYLRALLQTELDTNNISGLGKHHLYTYMRSKYNVIGRNRIYSLVRELDPEGVERRRKKAYQHRGHTHLAGPNEVWSLDAYCKLEHWGIQIYAAIDAYSRFVVWYYVGISGRTAVSVLGQYIDAITSQSLIPRKIRTDRGAETPMMADAHYALSNEIRPQEDGQPLPFRDVFRFGTSKENSYIERWWRQQSFGAILQWRDCFLEYSRTSDYNADWKADRIAFLAIYMPIIRSALSDFVYLWNNHRIRKQANRPYLACGIPYLLFNYPERTDAEQCGVALPNNSLVLQAIQNDLTGLDLDEFLPGETLAWCGDKLEYLGFSRTIDGSAIDNSGERIHKHAFIALRDNLRLHISQNRLPQLAESEKPWNARRWSNEYRPSKLIEQVFNDANEELVVTHPLDRLMDEMRTFVEDESIDNA